MDKKVIVFVENGRRRKGEEATCKACEKSFVRRISHSNGKKVFCSVECSSMANRSRVGVRCAVCQVDFELTSSRAGKGRSGLNFCSKRCMVSAQRLKGGLKQIHPPHYGTGHSRYKAVAFEEVEGPPCCKDCGLSFLPLLVVHHIDGNRKNGSASNLEILCHNHHAIRHMRLVRGVWKYSPGHLTPRDAIAQVRTLFEGLSFNGRTGPWHGSNEGSIPSSSTTFRVEARTNDLLPAALLPRDAGR